MANNFNLRSFLSENKLTKNAQLLKEEVSLDGKPVDMGSIEIDGIDMNDYPDFVDAYIVAAEFEDGTPLTDDELQELEDQNYGLTSELIHDRQLYLEEKKETWEEGVKVKETVKRTTNENKMTNRDKYLTRLVENALGIQVNDSLDTEGYGTDNLDKKREKRGLPPEQGPQYSEVANEEMVEKEPLPKYENIEKLMQEIEHGTNKASHEYKMNRMKEVAEMLEAKVGSLEEGEHAEHIDQKAVKQMRKDIAALRKAEEKLRKEFDKKFSGKEKKETPAKEKATEALQEGAFDLRKFLAENRKK